MPELALGLWAVYGIGALGTRVAIHLRRTGSTGLVGAHGRPGSPQWVGEHAHTLAIAAGLAAPILAVTGVHEPIGGLDERAVHIVGLVVFAIGLGGVLLGQSQMGGSWRIGTDPDERTELVTGGLFTLVRNPIYTAVTVTLVGLALLVPSALALASVGLFVLSVQIETRLIEEPHLLGAHGAAYADYAARAGRFVPGLGRLSPSGR